MIIEGEAVVFGDNINTDVMIPSKYLTSLDPNELAVHAMEGLNADFPTKARKGVVIVAGKNFGCGSSREQAPIALKFAGVRCILAESFARIFYRNAINIGLPVLELKSASRKIGENDLLMISLEDGKVTDESKNRVFQALKLPSFILEIINDGGLVEHITRKRRD